MSLVNISNLTFAYDGSYDNVFCNVSFQIDTDWKLGFCGRNGRGKTTFLKLLLGQLQYKGKITSSVKFDYFPFHVSDKNKTVFEIAYDIVPYLEQWILEKELNTLRCHDCLYRQFDTLSGGEQTKVLLAILFLRNNNFLLIDEPTNHLDKESRQVVSKFLNSKKGFILVSHDKDFLDGCVNHILSINKANIEIQKGNYSSWLANKECQDNYEIAENKKLASEIDRLKNASRRKSNWSGLAELKKQGASDKGFMGAKSARQMKTAKIIERRRENAIDDKMKLLHNIENVDDLRINPISHNAEYLVVAKDLGINFGNKKIFSNLNFEIKNGEKVSINSKNGSGKSSLLKLLVGENTMYSGTLIFANGLVVSYIPQDTSALSGSLNDFIKNNSLDETIFLSTLVKLDLQRSQLKKNMKDYSAGQKKKVYLAKSLCEKAHLYIWDEPLNYIDIISRGQIENMILKYQPTILFVEHDSSFENKIATKKINLN